MAGGAPVPAAGKAAGVPVLWKAEESDTQVGVSGDVLVSGVKGKRPGSSGRPRGPVAQHWEVCKVVWNGAVGFRLLGEWWRDSGARGYGGGLGPCGPSSCKGPVPRRHGESG